MEPVQHSGDAGVEEIGVCAELRREPVGGVDGRALAAVASLSASCSRTRATVRVHVGME